MQCGIGTGEFGSGFGAVWTWFAPSGTSVSDGGYCASVVVGGDLGA